MRQQKFKRGKEKMMSMAQESADGQTPVQPEEKEEGRTAAVGRRGGGGVAAHVM